MTSNDHDNEKRLDEYIDALNAGRHSPQLAEDAELIDLFATARDVHRLRQAEPQPDDVPSRLAAALERELRANPTHATRRIESTEMSRFRTTSSNGMLRPPDDTGGSYGLPQRPERARQIVQFALAAVAFVIVGVILAQIIGSGTDDEPGSAVGSDPGGSQTSDVAALGEIIRTPASLMPTVTIATTVGREASEGFSIPDGSNINRVTTFNDAQALTPFELVEPASVPQELVLDVVVVRAGPVFATPTTRYGGPVDTVEAYYRAGNDHLSVMYEQTKRRCDGEFIPENESTEVISIGGKSVSRTVVSNADGSMTGYRWQSGDICYFVLGILSDGVDEELLESLISEIPLPAPGIEATPPTVDEPDGLPTPDESGSYNVLTFAEARELTEFELIEPDSVPQELTLEGIKLYTELDMSTPGSFKVGPVDLVTAYYPHVQSGSVLFWQTTRGCNDPGMVGAESDDIDINGRTIRRTLGTNQSGDPLASYRWQSGEICYTVFAILEDGVDEELLAAFVSSIPRPDSEADPTASAVPVEPEFATLTVSPDYVTCEDAVIATGTNFEPGTTITIYGGQLIGDNFAPVVDEHPVADDGSFEVELGLARLISECGGGNEEREGSQYRLSADTGSSLVRNGIDPDGPSAMTVLTFARETPVEVRDRVRLSSCGTEVLPNATMLGEGGAANQSARECFAAAVEAGASAEFISHQHTVEGDIITSIHRSIGDGTVEVIVDATRDAFGSGEWQQTICVWNEMSNLEPFTFHWESCGEPVTIE